MKLILLGLLVALCGSFNEPVQDVFAALKPVLKAGDAQKLATYLNSSTDITIGTTKAPYGKAQAEIVLRDFFRDNPPADFTIVHTGSSKAGLKFAIGQYKSGKATYSVLIRMKETDKNWLIHEISFVAE